MLVKATPDPAQARNPDFMLTLGEIFTLIAYGQLILENAPRHNLDPAVSDQMFDCFIRDFSNFALQMYGKATTSARQGEYCLRMIQKPAADEARG